MFENSCMWLLCCTMFRQVTDKSTGQLGDVTDTEIFTIPARRQEIIKMTEQLIESINTGDFEAYT